MPAGLHARVEARGRATIIYLLPGLTAAERRTALQRARRSASMGYGPVLPIVGFAIAVILDRFWSTLRNGAAAVRGHPVLLVLPAILVLSAASVYVMTTAVTITNDQPRDAGSSKRPGPSPGASRGKRAAANIPQSGPPALGGADAPSISPSRSPRHHRSPSPRPTGSASPPPTSPTPGPPRSSSPSPTVPPTISPGPTSPSPSPSSSSSGACVTVASAGICLTV